MKSVGVDCAQLLIGVYAEADMISDFDTGEYPMQWMMHRSDEIFLGELENHVHEVSVPLPGDIVLFKFGRCYSHSGIVVEWPLFIHASITDRSVVYADAMQDGLDKRDKRFFSFWGDA